MKEIPAPLPNAPPAQDFSKLGFVYITVLGLANQVVPHTGSWRLLATAVKYLVQITPIVYMAFQAWPASPMGVQSDSGMGRVKSDPNTYFKLWLLNPKSCIGFKTNPEPLNNIFTASLSLSKPHPGMALGAKNLVLY
ncbi:hypothetical protein DSO57_1017145 [Entomophthora muscae]|uniref:Uncharacterized protein n=1 Tax=Entomophthora muscae TaxID=34485 RepID=A0ACC2RJD6_9FUNG|nr:hypothetical protein DSO57_1017145 [Entomophthora muscae]